MITPEQFLSILKQDKEEVYKIGTVGSVSNNKAKIKFDGEQVQSGKEYICLKSYNPILGERVLLARVKNTYVILGGI